MEDPHCLAFAGFGGAYVASYTSDTVYEISSRGVITEIINSSGDGEGHATVRLKSLARWSDNVYAIFLSGVIAEIMYSRGWQVTIHMEF